MARRLYSRRPVRRTRRTIVKILLMIIFIYLVRLAFQFKPYQVEFNYDPGPVRPELYPVSKTLTLPRGWPAKIPKIQSELVVETPQMAHAREGRLQELRATFQVTWRGYRQEAWGKDELRPISGGFKTPFCGWGATLVDSLDTLWIMELYDEFIEAVREVQKIDFTGTEGCQINLFETTIRHLGGLLSAFDLSGGEYYILIEKAVELAEVLFTAFDTPNRMPTPFLVWSATNPDANNHEPSQSSVLAMLGTLSLEFTRLSQITGNDKYFDGIQRVMNELEKWQSQTSLPGMWPAIVDSAIFNQSFALGSPPGGSEELFTLGALADSAYEYLPKQYMMLGGQSKQYRNMYERFVEVAKEHLFFRPMTIGNKDILLSGTVKKTANGVARFSPDVEHLSCFTGGMLAIAGKIFNRPDDVTQGRKLADGCVWAYQNTISGIMPEAFTAVPCENKSYCCWNEKAWYDAVDPVSGPGIVRWGINSERLSPGFAKVKDKRYLLRPEAIESVFILYRITGDEYWRERGWDMFTAISAHTKTQLAHSAIDNVLVPSPGKLDEMESFWLAETLKYFFLLYSDPCVVSLDEYVFNTEAHPLKRPS